MYEVVMTGFSQFQSYTASKEPPVPELMMVIFSNDGTAVIFIFDTPTNRLGMEASSFPCNSLFGFSGVDSLLCRFVSDTEVLMNLGGIDYVDVGSTVSLLGNRLKAMCQVVPDAPCSEWAYSASQTALVGTPVSPVTPSTGSGGRAWLADFAVLSSVGTDVDESLSISLNSQLTDGFYTYPVVLSASEGNLLEGTYTFIVTLCNFLNSCITGQATTGTSHLSPFFLFFFLSDFSLFFSI
jgi:hypothetical protein